MPVKNKHALYAKYFPAWQEVRDCVEGHMAIKKRQKTYLPMLSGQTETDYLRYASRAKFFGATGRTLDGLHGNIFRKAPEQSAEVSETFAKSLEDVDLAGTGIEQFVSDVISDSLQTNWGGILVDYARGEDAPSRRDAEELGLKAYMRYYPAESVINWKYRTIRGKTQLALVVLVKTYTVPAEHDRFVMKDYKKYRVLYIHRETMRYTQDVYDEKSGMDKPIESEVNITMNGKGLTEIPFFPTPGAVPEKPMLYDLAQLNIQHYQDTADYQNGKHYTSIPTPIAIGLKPEYDEQNKPKPMHIGGTRFQFFPNEEHVSGADVRFLEFSGNGMKALADGIQHLEGQMAILGAHIIAAEKRGVETAEALRIHRIGENGVLAAYTRNVSGQVTKAMRVKGLWDGESPALLDKWNINFNTDYDLSEENANALSSLLNGRASGEIPRMSLYMGLKALNLIPEQWDFDTFVTEVQNDKREVLPCIGGGLGDEPDDGADGAE